MSLSLRLFIHTAPPNTALVKVSGKQHSDVVIGGRMFAIPFIHRVDTLSLALRTILVNTHNGLTINGVGVSVESACQIKIQSWISPDEDTRSSRDHPGSKQAGMDIDLSAVRLAAQHFLGKTDEQIEATIKRTISGHQRAIIGSLTVEQLYRDRATFVARVLQLITSDMRNMGLTVVSYTVSDINDVNGYIDALGVTQTEKVKREASEGAARYRNAAKSRSALLEAEAHLIVNRENQKKIQSDQERMVAESKAQQAIVTQKAIQDKSYAISGAEQDAILFVKRKEALGAETQAELAVLKEMVERERLQKERQVNVEADSKLYQARLAADAQRAMAAAEAECVKLLGVAEANALRAKGLAEVEVLEKRIGVWDEAYVCVFLSHFSSFFSFLFHVFKFPKRIDYPALITKTNNSYLCNVMTLSFFFNYFCNGNNVMQFL